MTYYNIYVICNLDNLEVCDVMPMKALQKAQTKVRKQAKDPLRAAFATRAMNAVSKIMAQAAPGDLIDSVSEESDLETLARALVIVSEEESIKAGHRLLPARIRGHQMRRELLAAEGGVISVTKVADILQISRQAVEKRRQSGSLLAVEAGRRGYLYPAWQFEDDRMLTSVPRVLAALKGHSPWSMLRFFVNGNHRLEGRSPIQALRKGELEKVLRAASVFLEHGAA